MLSNIEAERARNNISKEDMARRINVSQKTYYNWIREETDIPGSALLKLSDMFGTTVDYLLKGSKFASDKEKEVV